MAKFAAVKRVIPGGYAMAGRVQVGRTGDQTRWDVSSHSKTRGTMTTTGNTKKQAIELHRSDRSFVAKQLRKQRAMRHRPGGSPSGGQFY